jgi:hypothetical protein
MTTRRIAVFFYGLFMDVELLHARGIHSTTVHPASVLGFALQIGRRATLVPESGSRAYGVVIELSHAEIKTLYSDSSVQDYRPEAVLAELTNGLRVPALCFNLVTPPGLDESNAEYAVKLRDLARRLALPDEYIDRIQPN